MPRIDNDVKLDFKDVLLRPKRSTLKSRADVSLFPLYFTYFLHPVDITLFQLTLDTTSNRTN